VFVAHEIGLPRRSRGRLRSARRGRRGSRADDATSTADRDELITRYGLGPGRVLAVPSAVDTELFAPADAETRRRMRNELGLPSGPLAVFVGGATPANRVGLSWIRRLAAADDRFTYVVVGGVAAPERRDNLIVTGRVRSVEPFLRAADVALCPVEHATGTRIKLLEALATGLPCVVFAESLHGTELDGGVHVLVSGKSEQELLASLTTLAADEALASGLGEAGRSFVAERHEAREAASILEEALLDLLDARPPRARPDRSPPEI
jgi:glycosyltransferase involved in cell wall biosynthesis